MTRSTSVGSCPIERFAKMQDVRLQIRSWCTPPAEPVDAFIGDDADNRMLADDGAAQIGDFHSVRTPLLVSSISRGLVSECYPIVVDRVSCRAHEVGNNGWNRHETGCHVVTLGDQDLVPSAQVDSLANLTLGDRLYVH